MLGGDVHVIALDLLGHGGSAKPADGDYSLGSYAGGVRDLLVALGLQRATLVGHSFGGGVAMQFAYQYPEFTERLVLVASGGLGSEVSVALRAASLPGTGTVLRAALTFTPLWVGRLAHRAARVSRLRALGGPDLDELAAALGSLRNPGARAAFVHTTRSALNWAGQRLTGTGRLYLLRGLPVLFLAGRQDRVIPAGHTVAAHESLPGSRLELVDSGHFPHVEEPEHTAGLLLDFMANTAGARSDLPSLRARLLDPSGVCAAGPRPSRHVGVS